VQRSALRAVLLAVLCLAVLTLAASTLDTVETGGSGIGDDPGGDDGGGPTPPDVGDEPRQPQGTTQPPDGGDDEVRLCEPAVKEPPVIIAVVAAAVLWFLALTYFRDEFVAIAGTLIVFGPITLLMLVLAQCDLQQPDDGSNVSLGNGTGNGTGAPSGGGGESAVPEPSLPIVALAALAAVVALVVIAYYLTGDDAAAEEESTEAEAEEEPAVDAEDVAEVGRLAGEAADRIEDAGDFENQVFRAWREMTRPLNVDHPRSSTPAEFAAAARAAGMDGGDVDRLTELFDEVRYGGREATPEREEEAVSLLRSIEAQYADVETPGDLPGVDGESDGGADDADSADGSDADDEEVSDG